MLFTVTLQSGRWCALTFALSCGLCVRAVLAPGVPADGAGHDPGRVLRSDPPTLPQQAVEAAALAGLLLPGGLRPGAHRPLGLCHRGLLLPAGAGEQNLLWAGDDGKCGWLDGGGLVDMENGWSDG